MEVIRRVEGYMRYRRVYDMWKLIIRRAEGYIQYTDVYRVFTVWAGWYLDSHTSAQSSEDPPAHLQHSNRYSTEHSTVTVTVNSLPAFAFTNFFHVLSSLFKLKV